MPMKQVLKVTVYETLNSDTQYMVHDDIHTVRVMDGFLVLTHVTELEQICYNVSNIARFKVENIGEEDV